MYRRALVYILATWVCALTLARPALSQDRFELGPLLGFYAPAGSFQPAPYYSTALPQAPGDMSALALGAQARLWLAGRVGIQLQGAIASSQVGGGATPGGMSPPYSVHVLTITAQALYNFYPAGRTRLWASGGAGLIRHGGAAYAPYGSPSQVAGVLGVGSALPLTARLNADLGLTTLFYSFNLKDSTATSIQQGFQVDPLVHVGLSWGWH